MDPTRFLASMTGSVPFKILGFSPESWQAFESLATVVTALIAVAAVFLAIRELRSLAREQQASAQVAFAQLLLAQFANLQTPMFALVDRPHLRPYFYSNVAPPAGTGRDQASVLAEMFLDCVESQLEIAEVMGSHVQERHQFAEYGRQLFNSSPIVRDVALEPEANDYYDSWMSLARDIIAAEISMRALIDDPLWGALIKQCGSLDTGMREMLAGWFQNCEASGFLDLRLNVGAAGWLTRDDTSEAAASIDALEQRLFPEAFGPHSDAMRSLFAEMDAFRETIGNHLYLEFLAVVPTAHGRGIGSELVEYRLSWADARGIPTYLETFKESNLAFYSRFGFDTVVQFNAPMNVVGWGLLRQPRGPRR